MGILQFLSQSKEALQGGVNELQQTGGGILKYLTNTYKKEKEDYYTPTPEVRPRDVLRESKLTLQNIGSKLQPPEMSQGEAMKQGLVKVGNTYIDPMFVGSLEKVGAKAVKPAVKPLVGKIMNKVDDTLKPLLTEAKKYKSVEEFMKAQGTPVYHGGKTEIKVFEDKGYGGVFLTPDKQMAKDHANFRGSGKITEAYTNPKRILDLENSRKIGIENIDEVIENPDKYKSDIAVIKGYGFDAIQSSDGKQLFVFDTSQVKTKSQLIDIWNKANK